MNLRQYQTENAKKGAEIIKKYGIVYLAMQVRTGKSLTALEICKLIGAKSVLFATKKKAIQSIESDYANFGYKFDLNVVNDESVHKYTSYKFDIVIHDESHRFGSIGKPNVTAKLFKKHFANIPMILLSGTPTPESFSQIYHQFWISRFSPFKEINFYKWAKTYVNVKQKNVGYAIVNDYTDAKQDMIEKIIAPYMINYTQEQAGFSNVINEHICEVDMKESTYRLINRLKQDKCIVSSNDSVTADTGAKMMQKHHQLCSGSIILDSGNTCIFDYTKAEFIEQKFKGIKIVIFYKFKAEYDLLLSILGLDVITNDINEFNATDKSIALQIVSGREGINLSKADAIVYYNIDFSATSYWQSRDRLTTIDRLKSDVYWIFSKNGIESKIYKTVLKKKNFTLKHYEKRTGFTN